MLQELDSSKKNISSFKRIFIFIIDALISFSLFIILFVTIGNFSIKNIEKEHINQMNDIYIKLCIDENIPYSDDNQYNLMQIDFNTYMDNKVNEGYSSEEAYTLYNDAETKLNEELSKNNEYVNLYNSFYITYNLTLIISMFISLFIFQFIIPLLNKYHQTLGMMIFKSTIVNYQDIIVSNKTILLRFFTIFITEYVLVFIILNWLGLIFVILASLFSISITKRKASLHDLILKIKISYLDYAYSE